MKLHAKLMVPRRTALSVFLALACGANACSKDESTHSIRLTLLLPPGMSSTTAAGIGPVQVVLDEVGVASAFTSVTDLAAARTPEGLEYQYRIGDPDGDGKLEFWMEFQTNPFAGGGRSITLTLFGKTAYGTIKILAAALRSSSRALLASGIAQVDTSNQGIQFLGQRSVVLQLECTPTLGCPVPDDAGVITLPDGGVEEGDITVRLNLPAGDGGIAASVQAGLGPVRLYFDEPNADAGLFKTGTERIYATTDEFIPFATQITNADSDSNFEYLVDILANPFVTDAGVRATFNMNFFGAATIGTFVVKGKIFKNDGGVLVATAFATTDTNSAAIVFGTAARTVDLNFACVSAELCAEPDAGGLPDIEIQTDAGPPVDASIDAGVPPPDTTILDGGPAAGSATTSTSAAFSLSCSAPPCTYICTFDDAGANCDGGAFSVSSLADGVHAFTAAAQSDAGATDETPATRTWTVDTTAPVCALSLSSVAAAWDAGQPLVADAGATITAAISDALSSVFSAQVVINDAGAAAVQDASDGLWRTAWTPTRLTHTVSASSADALGNAAVCSGGGTIYTAGLPALSVIGQSISTDFTGNCPGGAAAAVRGYFGPHAMEIDVARARLFISDYIMQRIAVHNLNPTTFDFDDYNIDYVIGKPSVTNCQYDAGREYLLKPTGLAYDDARSLLFVSDYSRNRVVIHDVSNLTSGQAAKNVLGQPDLVTSTGGTSAAKMSGPVGLSFDSSKKRLFVADNANNRVLVFDTTVLDAGMDAIAALGQSSMVTNTAAAGTTGLSGPIDVAYSPNTKRLFVSEYNNNRVLVFDVADASTGQAAVNVIGQPDFTTTFPGTSAQKLSIPVNVELEADGGPRLFVAEDGNRRILSFNIGGGVVNGMSAEGVLGQTNFVTVANNSLMPRTANQFGSYLRGLLHLAQGNRLFASDYYNLRILRFDVAAIDAGENADYVLGQTYWDGGIRFDNACGADVRADGFTYREYYGGLNVTVDSVNRRLFVGDNGSWRVLVFLLDANLNPISKRAQYVLGQPDPSTCQPSIYGARVAFTYNHMVVDGPGNLLFVPQAGNSNRVLVYHFDGGITDNMPASWALGATDPDQWGPAGAAGQAGLNYPYGLAYDAAKKRLFVADNFNHRVVMFDFDGGISNGMDASVVFGQPDFSSTSAGSGSKGLRFPRAVGFDPVTERLFVADSSNYRVMVFEAANPTSGADAGFVIGQPDFATTSYGTLPGKAGSVGPLEIDPIRRRLFLSGGSSIVVYDLNTLTTGMNASTVIGRQSFTDSNFITSQTNSGSTSDVSLAATEGRLFVADPTAYRILVFDVTP